MSRTLCVSVTLALVGVAAALHHVPVVDLLKAPEDVLVDDDMMGADAAGDHWATDYESGKWGVKSTVELDNCTRAHPTWSCDQDVYCTYWEGQFKISATYTAHTKDGSTEDRTVDVYIPSDAIKDEDESTCDSSADMNLYKYKHGDKFQERMASSSVLALHWLDRNVSVKLTFSNSSNEGCVGWKMFVIHKVELTVKGAALSNFEGFMGSELSLSAATYDNHDGWWKLLSSPYGSLNECKHTKSVELSSNLTFTMQNVVIGALMYGYVNQNGTVMPKKTMCYFDYEKDDALAVIIGSVQTGIVFLTLIGYLIYLNRRGPIEVPNWIVEPSMRNATVKKIEDAQYERRMSKTAVDGSQPVQRKTMPSDDTML